MNERAFLAKLERLAVQRLGILTDLGLVQAELAEANAQILKLCDSCPVALTLEGRHAAYAVLRAVVGSPR